jgi:hypothetical protein
MKGAFSRCAMMSYMPEILDVFVRRTIATAAKLQPANSTPSNLS